MPKRAQVKLDKNDYDEAMSNPKFRLESSYIKIGGANLRELVTQKVTTNVLNSNDKKRYITDNGSDSLALGHYKTIKRISV